MAYRMEAVESASLPLVNRGTKRSRRCIRLCRPWRTRTAYRCSVEITVYVSPERAGRGIGSMLYGKVMPRLAVRGSHSVMGASLYRMTGI